MVRKNEKVKKAVPVENSAAAPEEGRLPKETVEAAKMALQKVAEEAARAWASVTQPKKLREELERRYRKVQVIKQITRALAINEFIEMARKQSGAKISESDIVAHKVREGWFFTCRHCGNPITASRAKHVESCKDRLQLLRQMGLCGIYRIGAPEGSVFPDLIEIQGGKVFCAICGEEVKGLDHFKNGDNILGCQNLEKLLRQKKALHEAIARGWYVAIHNNRLRVSSQGE